MKLSTRLVLWTTLVLITLVMVMGAVVVQTSRSVLVSQIDDELRTMAHIGAVAERRGRPPGFGILPDEQAVALIRFDRTGAILAQVPSGYPDEPDPLPDISRLEAPGDSPYVTTVPSVDGTSRYRAVVYDGFANTTNVVAVPLDEVDAATATMLRFTLVTAATVAVIGGAATWWIITKAMRPVDDMVDAAADIASGNLTRRVDSPDDHSELGRLGTALNEMMGRIEEGFETERAAQERLQQFVADASHELRTPLTTISGYMELYQRGALEDVDAAATRIRREAARMQRLVEDMLLLARLDRHSPLNLARFDVMRLVHDAAANHRAVDQEREVVVIGPETAVMVGDEERIGQVLANLLANARTHTPPGSRIEVRVEEDDATLTVEVADDGPGIDPEAIPHLFDRFYRADGSRARRTGGSGLGLAIVKAIVDAHGGSVTVRNRAEGGAAFTVAVPKGHPASTEPNSDTTASENAGQVSSAHGPN